jgi:hypothetical protein
MLRARAVPELAQHADPGAPFPELGGLGHHVFLEQGHQRFDLFRGALPVFLAEGEQGEHVHPRLDAPLHALPYRGHPGLMPRGAGEIPPRGPAAVPIHDDGDVRGDAPVHADAAQELLGGRGHTSMISASLV